MTEGGRGGAQGAVGMEVTEEHTPGTRTACIVPPAEAILPMTSSTSLGAPELVQLENSCSGQLHEGSHLLPKAV